MKEDLIKQWRSGSNVIVFLQITLNKLKKEKRITKKQAKNVQKQIKILSDINFVKFEVIRGRK